MKLKWKWLIWVLCTWAVYMMIVAQDNAMQNWQPTSFTDEVPLEGLDVFILSWFLIGSVMLIMNIAESIFYLIEKFKE